MALSQSSFFKWRCLIALANVDAKLDPGEKQFFSDQLKALNGEGITEDQLKTLKNDLINPMQPEVFFIRVDDPLEKIDLLRMAYFLFMSDDDFEIREKQVYQHLLTEVSKAVDVPEKVLDEIAKMKSDKLSVSIKPLIMKFLEQHGHKIKGT